MEQVLLSIKVCLFSQTQIMAKFENKTVWLDVHSVLRKIVIPRKEKEGWQTRTFRTPPTPRIVQGLKFESIHLN